MIADGRFRGGRHRRQPVTDRKTVRWRRAAAAIISLGVAGITIVALSSPAGAARPLARATLLDASGAAVGEVLFKGMGTYADRVEVDIDAPMAPKLGDFHGLHIHTFGVCNPAPSGSTLVAFGSAGGHLNPDGVSHGAHEGDLPSVLLTPKGQAYTEFETARIEMTSLLDADGSAVVLHAGPDNFANIPSAYGAPNATTLATGDAGARYACGVVESI